MSTSHTKRQRHAGKRTCVGCGALVDRSGGELMRLVFHEDEAIVDLGGSLDGRGAWVHARNDCVDKAAKSGLSRSARGRIKTDAAALYAQIVAQADRRAGSLIGAAFRARRLAIGAQAVRDSEGQPLVLVAKDAAAAAKLPAVAKAQERGDAIAWSDKAHLGALLGRGDVGVLAITDEGIAQALRHAVSLSQSFSAEKRS